jgi:hypothetical protein
MIASNATTRDNAQDAHQGSPSHSLKNVSNVLETADFVTLHTSISALTFASKDNILMMDHVKSVPINVQNAHPPQYAQNASKDTS